MPDRPTAKSASAPDQHPSQKKLHVGVVGIGRMGQSHALNVLHRSPRASLLCVCSPAPSDLAWANEHLAPYGVQVFDTFEVMIHTPGLQAVIIASATALHMSHTLTALDAGLHVLCEKPISTSIADLGALLTRTRTQPPGSPSVMVGFVRRFDADYQDVYAKLASGAIGRPLIIRSHQSEKLDTSDAYKAYLAASGGIFADSVIHDIDLALFFLGEENCVPKSVSAVGTAAVHTQLAESGDADNAVGVCEFWGGRVAYFHNSRTAAHGFDNATEIFGTKGKLSVNLVSRRNRVELCDGDGFVKVESLTGWYERYEGAFVREVNAWVEAVLEGRSVPVPLSSCVTSLVIATALQESLRTGEKIEFGRDGVRVASKALKALL